MWQFFLRRNASSHFTNRENDIIGLLLKGYLNKQIADKLGISERTVKNHNTSIFLKLGATNRTEAVLRYLELKGRNNALVF